MVSPDRRRFVVFLGWLTGSRLVFAAGVAGLATWSEDKVWATVVSLALLVLVELTDLLDGFLARRYDAVSDFGKAFDPYCDSVSRLTVYWALAVAGRCPAWVPLVMAVRDVTVSYARIMMTRRGGDVSARFSGKFKAVVQGGCAFVLMAALPQWLGAEACRAIYWSCGGAVAAVTLWSLCDYTMAAVSASGPPMQTDADGD
jgi:CDP-diacylglycerol---glycerol-3-phosphate 3-phosphatidyltransferase